MILRENAKIPIMENIIQYNMHYACNVPKSILHIPILIKMIYD